jgi:hypothetical protein
VGGIVRNQHKTLTMPGRTRRYFHLNKDNVSIECPRRRSTGSAG